MRAKALDITPHNHPQDVPSAHELEEWETAAAATTCILDIRDGGHGELCRNGQKRNKVPAPFPS